MQIVSIAANEWLHSPSSSIKASAIWNSATKVDHTKWIWETSWDGVTYCATKLADSRHHHRMNRHTRNTTTTSCWFCTRKCNWFTVSECEPTPTSNSFGMSSAKYSSVMLIRWRDRRTMCASIGMMNLCISMMCELVVREHIQWCKEQRNIRRPWCWTVRGSLSKRSANVRRWTRPSFSVDPPTGMNCNTLFLRISFWYESNQIQINTWQNWIYFLSGKTKLVDLFCTMTNRYCNIDTIDDSVTGSFQQVDLNRHLEGIAQQIESHLVRYQQNWVLHCSNRSRSSSKNDSAQFIKLLRQWEEFADSSHNYQNGKLVFRSCSY